MAHLLLKPYLNQGLNVFQRLALVSQFFTVFGSLMFVVQNAVAKNNAATEDSNGKLLISFLIMFVNAAAGGLYPLYRFFNAWSESGEIDMEFVKSSLSRCFSFFLGTQLADYLMGSCGCLIKAKKLADKTKEEADKLQAAADELRNSERVSTAERYYNDAKSAKEQVDEAKAVYKDGKAAVSDVRAAANDLQKESGVSTGNQLTDDQNQAGPDPQIHEDDITIAENSAENVLERGLPSHSLPHCITVATMPKPMYTTLPNPELNFQDVSSALVFKQVNRGGVGEEMDAGVFNSPPPVISYRRSTPDVPVHAVIPCKKAGHMPQAACAPSDDMMC